MHKNELMRIASDLGILAPVLIKEPFLGTAFSVVADNQLLTKGMLNGCFPQNSFQPNHYMRLNAISPASVSFVNQIPGHNNNTLLNYGPNERNEGLIFLNNLATDTHKPSFALESIVFNPNMLNVTKKTIQDAQCEKMKALLDSAPCCGPCVNCAARPESLFEKIPKMCRPNGEEIPNLPNTFINNIKENWKKIFIPSPAVAIGSIVYDAIVDHNAKPCKNADGSIRYEAYQYIKPDTYDKGWFTDDSNATTFPCDRKRDKGYIWADNEKYYNGIDFMENYNLWLMACGNGNEDNPPKLTQPNPLVQVEGCENAGKVHIQGPDEVCKGETVKFNISTGAVHTPVDGDANWKLEGTVLKEKKDNPKGDKEIPDFMNKTNISFPNITGAQTISYQFNVGGQVKTISKTVTVIDGPANPPNLTGQYMDMSRCRFQYSFTPQQSGNTFISSNGDADETNNSITVSMKNEPYDITVYEVNRCGKSQPIVLTIPAAPNHCGSQNRVIKDNANGISPNEIELWSNPVSKTVTVKCDVLYNAPFDAKLYDLTGRLVDTQHFNNVDIVVDYSVKDLQAALYIFVLYSDGTFIKSTKFYLENY